MILKELLKEYVNHPMVLTELTDEMACRLRALDEVDWEMLAAPFQGLTSVKERHAWRAAVTTARDKIRRILDGETTP